MLIYEVPVQILPANEGLAAEAVAQAVERDYEGVTVRVMKPEHLIAMFLTAGGARRRERVLLLQEARVVDYEYLAGIWRRFNLPANLLPKDADQ